MLETIRYRAEEQRREELDRLARNIGDRVAEVVSKLIPR